jgi:replicative DNA helicase
MGNSQTDYTSDVASVDVWADIEELQNTLASQLRTHDAGKEISAESVLQAALKIIEEAKAHMQPGSAPTDFSVRDLLEAYWATVQRRQTCAPTGIKGLDDAIGGGLESKRLFVVLGAPNSGKTTLVHQVADHVADSGRPVLYVTSEDSPHDLMSKTLARIGNIGYTSVKKGWKSEEARIKDAIAAQLERKSVDLLRYVDASNGITLDTIRKLAQAHFSHYAAGGQGLLVIDYLQRLARAIRLMGVAAMDLREAVTLLTEQLRALACELDCSVIAVASQHRASGYRLNENTLASAKESGDIEYTADVMMALGDDEERKKGQTKGQGTLFKPLALKIDKNRLGDRDRIIQLDFQPDRQMFTEASR